jgi:hypothetical protein
MRIWLTVFLRQRLNLLIEEQVIEEAWERYPQVAKRGELDIKPRWPVI